MKDICDLAADLQMKMLSWCLFCRSRAHGLVTSSPAVAGGRHPLPVPHSCGTGPGAPPATAGEVAQTFRSHSEETPGKTSLTLFLLPLESSTPMDPLRKGQGDLRSKAHSEQPLSSPVQGTCGGLRWHQYSPTTLRLQHE